MKNLKFYLMALTAIFLIGCGGKDSRADDKAMIAEEEFKLGHITMEEAECIANLYSDNLPDDDKWATLVSMYDYTMEEQYELGLKAGAGEKLTAEEQKMLDVSMESIAIIPKIKTACDVDVFEISAKRMEDLQRIKIYYYS